MSPPKCNTRKNQNGYKFCTKLFILIYTAPKFELKGIVSGQKHILYECKIRKTNGYEFLQKMLISEHLIIKFNVFASQNRQPKRIRTLQLVLHIGLDIVKEQLCNS